MKKEHFLLFISLIIIATALILRFIDNPRLKPIDNNSKTETTSEQLPGVKTQPAIYSEDGQIVGGDRDEHGCIGSAGYGWCESKQKCLRIWEEDCPSNILEVKDTENQEVAVAVSYPLPGDLVTSPLSISGRARGTWFFEASLPISLIAVDGTLIVSHYGEAKSDWMTTDFVPFESVLEFNTEVETGYLVIAKDNPSGLPENNDQVMIPVRFK